MNPFFVTGLPRSGTAWLSAFLSHGDTICYHELLADTGPVATAVAAALVPHHGCADTATPLIADRLVAVFPRAPWVIVLRDPPDAYASLRRAFPRLSESDATAVHGAACLALVDLVRILPAHLLLFVPFADLFSDASLQAIWRHVRMPYPYPAARAAILRNLRITDNRWTPTAGFLGNLADLAWGQ
jgi:hypothetical protein